MHNWGKCMLKNRYQAVLIVRILPVGSLKIPNFTLTVKSDRFRFSISNNTHWIKIINLKSHFMFWCRNKLYFMFLSRKRMILLSVIKWPCLLRCSVYQCRNHCLDHDSEFTWICVTFFLLWFISRSYLKDFIKKITFITEREINIPSSLTRAFVTKPNYIAWRKWDLTFVMC